MRNQSFMIGVIALAFFIALIMLFSHFIAVGCTYVPFTSDQWCMSLELTQDKMIRILDVK